MANNSKKTSNATKNAAVEAAQDAEAQVFGDGAAQALPVTEVSSADEQTQVQEVTDQEAMQDTPVIPDAQAEASVFGGGVPDIQRETQQEQTVAVPLSVIENMQRQIAELQASNGDQVIDPLNLGDRKKLINATFYSTDDGTQYLVTGMKERVFPNGTKARVYQDGVDPDTKKPVYKALIEVANVETGEIKVLEVIYENFIKLSTPVQTEAVKTNEKNVDMTPSDETVEVSTYTEVGGYVKRQGSGVRVRASVIGKIQTFNVQFNGRTFELSSDVVNIK